MDSSLTVARSDADLTPFPPLGDERLNLYAWQEEAFEAWVRAGRRGIVEAVTGAGKTRLGLAAIAAAAIEGRQTLLIVPTIELLHQWFHEIRDLLPWVKVGRLGDQYRDTFVFHQVVVATVQSALKQVQSGPLNSLIGNSGRLMVVDEVHRLAGDTFAQVLHKSYSWRLGLSATYERPDEKHLEHLDPYFGGVIYRLWYERAKADNLIAPFDVALIGVDLEPDEYREYADLSEQIRSTHRSLQGYMSPAAPSVSVFMSIVAGWAAEDNISARTILARKYMRAVTSRQRLLSETTVKLRKLSMLSPALQESRSTLIFSLTRAGAEEAASQVSQDGVSATAVFSEMNRTDRNLQMAAFRKGNLPILAAPRVLDEGVDVPEAELAIVLAANRSKRQLVQRLGRVIRRKPDGRAGKFVFFYAKGTIEDPEISGDAHLNEILPHARNLGWFVLPEDIDEILQFLKNPASKTPPPPPRKGRYSKPESHTPISPDPGPAKAQNQTYNEVKRITTVTPQPPVRTTTAPSEDEDDAWDGEVPEQLKGRAFLGRDSVHLYLRQIGAYKLLSAHEEVRLGREIEAGVLAYDRLIRGEYQFRRERRELETIVRQGKQAHRTFICANLRLVVNISKRYTPRAGTLDFLDLIQEGNLGLERALQMWDFTRGLKFSTYATWWIQQSIQRAIDSTSRTIRLPVHRMESLRKAQTLWTKALETVDEERAHTLVAKELGLTNEELDQLFSLERTPMTLERRVWIIEPGHIQEVSFGDKILDDFAEDLDVSLMEQDLRSTVDAALRELQPRQERVLRLRFGIHEPGSEHFGDDPRTLDAIGQELDLTRERIRQIVNQTTRDLAPILRRLGVDKTDLA